MSCRWTKRPPYSTQHHCNTDATPRNTLKRYINGLIFSQPIAQQLNYCGHELPSLRPTPTQPVAHCATQSLQPLMYNGRNPCAVAATCCVVHHGTRVWPGCATYCATGCVSRNFRMIYEVDMEMTYVAQPLRDGSNQRGATA